MPAVGKGIGSDKNGQYTKDFFADYDGEQALNRSIIFAFLCALLLHSVVALVDLNAFKKPSTSKILPKALTMNIVQLQPIKKPSIAKNAPKVVKTPLVKKRIIKNTKPLQKIKPKVATLKKVQPDTPLVKKTSAEPNKTLIDPPPISFPKEMRKQDDFIEEFAFIPDMVDIPQAIPNINNTPQSESKTEILDVVSHIPVTYAHPIYKYNISPPYPLLARKRGYQGTALLDILVGTDGKATSIRLNRSSGYGILDRAAIKGVRDWLFYPAKRGDDLFEMWVKIPIRFILN